MKKIWLAITGSLLLSGSLIAQNPPQEQNKEEKNQTFFYTQNPPQDSNGEKDQTFFYQKLPTTNAPRAEDLGYVSLMAESKTVKNAPYTAKEVTESTQVLSDGNRIVNKSEASVARDGEGRTRHEQEGLALGGLQARGPKVVMINDPVAHAHYTFVSGDAPGSGAMVVHSGEGADMGVGGGEFRHGLPEKIRVFNSSRNVAGPTEFGTTNEGGNKIYFNVEAKSESDDVKHESLGSQVIEGVTVEGTRETRTIPAGKIGNERPIVITVEKWTSPDLQLVVLSKRNDPRFGETVYKLTDIVRGEPDPSLFHPPGATSRK